jgi:hypothetical protein
MEVQRKNETSKHIREGKHGTEAKTERNGLNQSLDFLFAPDKAFCAGKHRPSLSMEKIDLTISVERARTILERLGEENIFISCFNVRLS